MLEPLQQTPLHATVRISTCGQLLPLAPSTCCQAPSLAASTCCQWITEGLLSQHTPCPVYSSGQHLQQAEANRQRHCQSHHTPSPVSITGQWLAHSRVCCEPRSALGSEHESRNCRMTNFSLVAPQLDSLR